MRVISTIREMQRVAERLRLDLNFDIDVPVAPIVREAHGLAMSSRNVYLNPRERNDALVLRKALDLAERMINSGEHDAAKIRRKMRWLITSSSHIDPDYVAIVERTLSKSFQSSKKTADISRSCSSCWKNQTH